MADITTQPFGAVDGREVTLFTLTNGNGMSVAVMNYGVRIQAIRTPARDGRIEDVVLGYDTFESYLGDAYYLGAVCGRVANRIARGRFRLDGGDYTLAVNNETNALHGGIKGFDKQVWDAEQQEYGVRFSRQSPDGEEGYPGTLDVAVCVSLTEDNALTLEYEAATDKPTILNLTNHSYFNLKGQRGTTVHDHKVAMAAGYYTPLDNDLIPTGELASVESTPFDFRESRRIGERIDMLSSGYDINYVRDPDADVAVKVIEPVSGRTLEMETTEPGFQFYTGYFLDNVSGKGGIVYPRLGAFCLEAQHYPNSINQPGFPSTVLRPGETYAQCTLYRFGV